MVEPNHLHGTDLEPCGEYVIDDLSNIFVFDSMRFDDTKSAVFIIRARLHIKSLTLTTASLENMRLSSR